MPAPLFEVVVLLRVLVVPTTTLSPWFSPLVI